MTGIDELQLPVVVRRMNIVDLFEHQCSNFVLVLLDDGTNVAIHLKHPCGLYAGKEFQAEEEAERFRKIVVVSKQPNGNLLDIPAYRRNLCFHCFQVMDQVVLRVVVDMNSNSANQVFSSSVEFVFKWTITIGTSSYVIHTAIANLLQ